MDNNTYQDIEVNSECKKIGFDNEVMIDDAKEVKMIVYRPLTWYQKLLNKIKRLFKIIKN